jgi:hypothetical protein
MSVCPSAYIRVYPLSVAPDHERARAHARTSHARISMRHMRDHARTSVSARERTSTGAMGAYQHMPVSRPVHPCASPILLAWETGRPGPAGSGSLPPAERRRRICDWGRSLVRQQPCSVHHRPRSRPTPRKQRRRTKQNSDKNRVAAHTRPGKSAWQQHHAPGHARRERGKGMGGLRFKLPVTAWAGSARRGIPGLGIQCISYWISSFPENRRPS